MGERCSWVIRDDLVRVLLQCIICIDGRDCLLRRQVRMHLDDDRLASCSDNGDSVKVVIRLLLLLLLGLTATAYVARWEGRGTAKLNMLDVLFTATRRALTGGGVVYMKDWGRAPYYFRLLLLLFIYYYYYYLLLLLRYV